MKIIPGRAEGARAETRDGTFTGTVWGDPLMLPSDGVTMNTVYFSPCGRTYWHSHTGGQVIHVSSGEGWIAQRDEAPVKMRTGDTVWTPPNIEHWHGAAEGAFLVHVAVTIGETNWLEEVGDTEFEAAGTDLGQSK